MASITLRSVKGSPLTNAEVDANFSNINTELGQKLVSSDLNPYLLSATAASTYQTISGMSSYLTTSAAASTYLALAGGTLTGNLTFSGNSRRITGDFSNGTLVNRLALQTSTTNGNTGVFLLPNGTSQISTLRAYNASDPTNAAYAQLQANSTTASVISGISGTGTQLPLAFFISATEVARLSTGGRFLIGTTTDNGLDILQVNGSSRFTGDMWFNGTGAVNLPQGTTAQRPASKNAGAIRFNLDANALEVWDATNGWTTVGSGGGGGGGTSVYTRQFVYTGTTTNATETEIFVNGVSNNRPAAPSAGIKVVGYVAEFIGIRNDAGVNPPTNTVHIIVRGTSEIVNSAYVDDGGLFEQVVVRDDPNVSVDVRQTGANIGVFVTGAASQTYKWRVILSFNEV